MNTAFTCYCGHTIICHPSIERKRTCCPAGIYEDVQTANQLIVRLTNERVAYFTRYSSAFATRTVVAKTRAEGVYIMIENLLAAKVAMDYAALHPELCLLTTIIE